MPAPAAGDLAPDFVVETTLGRWQLSQSLKQGPVVVVFFREALTPTCTHQITAFQTDFEVLAKMGAQVLGISPDSIQRQREFAGRLGQPPFPLGSDPDLAVASLYHVTETDGSTRRAVLVVDEHQTIRLRLDPFHPDQAEVYLQIFDTLDSENP